MLRSRVLGWFFFFVTALIGLACVYGAVTEAADRAPLAAAAAISLGAAAVVWAGVLARGDAAARTSLVRAGGGPALVVRLRTTTPRVMTIVGAVGSVVTVGVIVGVGVLDGGLLFAPLLLLWLPVLIEGAWAFTRKAQLAITADELHYRGWGLDGRLGWDDVERIEYRVEGKYSRVWVIGRSGAPSWECRRTQLILPLDPKPKRPEFGVLISALDDPNALYATLRMLHEAAPARRASYIGEEGVALLRRQVGVRP